MNQPVYKNLGTWATGTTSKWGKAFKAVLDYFGNISMTLTHPHDFMDLDALYGQNAVTPAFGGNPEACGKACMDWYAEYYKVNYPHADDEAETGDFYTVQSFAGEKDAYDLMIGDKAYLSMKLNYADGHTKDVSEVATYTIDHPSVVEVKNGYLIALSDGDATITASYTDVKGTVWQASFTVKVSKFEISGMTSMSSLSEMVEDHFAILNKESQKLFYGSDAQNLGYDDANMVINNKNINGYMFKAEPISGREGCYLLRLITLSGSEYSIWGSPGYLNGYSTVADCSFILGLNNQYGQDVKDGAVWEINYESGKGFTLKNMYTGKYLRDNASASSEAPVYMDFLKVGGTAGVNAVQRDINDDAVYTLQGQKIATRSQWNTLPRGVYIVNGKKVIK